ncbi:MAG: DinB family protein [Isosphaeraceae bacterium]
MTGVQAIQTALKGTQSAMSMFLSDFTDADLFVRPVPTANHAAWQIGNVIVGDAMLIQSQLPDAAYPELPAGFVETHGPEGAKKDGPDGFLTKAEYLSLFDKVRSATIDAVGALSDADLDRPVTGDFAKYAPTLGHLFLLVSDHTLMHAGQFTVIRRLLGKPVLF